MVFKLLLFSIFIIFIHPLHRILGSVFTPKFKAVEGSSSQRNKVRPQFVTVDGDRQEKAERCIGHKKQQIQRDRREGSTIMEDVCMLLAVECGTLLVFLLAVGKVLG